MSALFPAAFLEKAYMGALIPFTLRSVYGTHAFREHPWARTACCTAA